MSDLHLLVHDVEPPEGHALGLVEAAEGAGDVSPLVRQEGDLDTADPALGPAKVHGEGQGGGTGVSHLGVLVQLRWENSESTDTATTSHLASCVSPVGGILEAHTS